MGLAINATHASFHFRWCGAVVSFHRHRLQHSQLPYRSEERLGVDIMEAGFPVSSPGDFNSVQMIAREVKNSIVCGLARAVEADIDACGNALKVADQFRIHTFLATSDIHIEHKLRKTRDQVIDMAVGAIKYARRYTDDVEFSCEDAGRTDIDYLCRVVEAAINAGASTINIPDTVGYTIPTEFGNIVTNLMNRVPNIDKATISVHCHNDLGLAVANSLAAVEQGARQVECTMNGIGERAGNTSLEEIAMILQTRESLLGLKSNINSTEIHRTSKLVSQLCNMSVQSNKAIVGTNAFSHSSGIHQDGVLKKRDNFEIIAPQDVGWEDTSIVLSPRSGRHALRHRLEKLGYNLTKEDLDKAYDRFIEVADKKKEIFDEDLMAIVGDELRNIAEIYKLEHLQTVSGTGAIPSATVRITIEGFM